MYTYTHTLAHATLPQSCVSVTATYFGSLETELPILRIEGCKREEERNVLLCFFHHFKCWTDE